MKLDFVEITPLQTAEVWAQFPSSPAQRVFHNELVKKILEDRDQLEKCTPGEVMAIQQRILARRELLGFLHRNDKEK